MNRLLDWNQLSALIPYSRQHLGRLEAKGLFPKRRWLSANRVAWDSGEIQEWLDSRRPGGPPQKPDLGPKRTAPEPDPADVALLREMAAKHGLGLTPLPEKKPERRGRPRGSS